MARPSADFAIQTKTARARLAPRSKPYYRNIGPSRSLGYLKLAQGAGRWVIREWVGGLYKQRVIAHADDVARADGRDVLTYEQASRAGIVPTATAPVGRLTVAKALDGYLTRLAAKSKHAGHYRAIADKSIVPDLGPVRVDRLTKTQIERWQAALVRDDGDEDERRRSRDTANRVLTILKAALNQAFADDSNGIHTDAAWRRVKPFENVARGREDDLAPNEVRALLNATKEISPALALLIEGGYRTGARLGELINADVRHLVAARALRVDGKTGPRTVSLTTEGAAFLLEVAGDRDREAPLFVGVDGERWKRADMRRPLKRAIAAAGLPGSVCFYTLRHSHISRALEHGMPVQLVAENVGTSVLMITKNYAHVLARTRHDTIQKTSPQIPS